MTSLVVFTPNFSISLITAEILDRPKIQLSPFLNVNLTP